MKKTILTVVAVAAIAVNARAQQAITLLPNRSYIFTGSAATGTDITYQWYRNSVAIANATSQSYTLPANLANGVGVEFKRGAISSSCPGQVTYSNIYYISFCGLTVSNVCWASENVAANKTFASRPDEYTQFYQWNRTTAWAAVGSVSGWNSTADNSSTWTVNPCPSGWRLPTLPEFQDLINTGYTWVAANSPRATTAGYFFGPRRATCSLPFDMTDCIFLSGGGRRNASGTLSFQAEGTRYWTSTQVNTNYGYGITDYSVDNSYTKAWGLNIRCVQ